MSIKSVTGKENHFVKDIKMKTNFQEHIGVLTR